MRSQSSQQLLEGNTERRRGREGGRERGDAYPNRLPQANIRFDFKSCFERNASELLELAIDSQLVCLGEYLSYDLWSTVDLQIKHEQKRLAAGREKEEEKEKEGGIAKGHIQGSRAYQQASTGTTAGCALCVWQPRTRIGAQASVRTPCVRPRSRTRSSRARPKQPYSCQKTKQNKTKQNKTKQNKTKQNKTKQNKTKQNKTKQNKTKQNKTKQNKTMIHDNK